MQQSGGGGGWNPGGGAPPGTPGAGFGAAQPGSYGGQQPQQAPAQGYGAQPGAAPGYGAQPAQPQAPAQGYGAPATDPNAAGAFSSANASYGGGGASPYRPIPQTGIDTNKGFFGSLFDFSFTNFVTTKVIKVLYGILIVCSTLMWGAAVLNCLNRINSPYPYGKDEAYMILLASPFVFALSILMWRMLLEMTIVMFRISENLSDINRKTRD